MDSEALPLEVLRESNYTNRILSSIAFALLYYDFVLTIPQEVERFWWRKLSLPSFLFFLNRYMSVLSHIPVIVEFFGVIPESVSIQMCRKYQQYHRVISIVIQGVVAVLLSVLGVGAIISLWVLIASRQARRPPDLPNTVLATGGCDLTLSTREGYESAIAWSAILVFDGTVFVLTAVQVLKARRGWTGGYFQVMLRDGCAYFGVLFACYLSNILAYALAKPVHKGVSTSVTNVMSSTLITRLMLNIRDPALHERPHPLELTVSDSSV